MSAESGGENISLDDFYELKRVVNIVAGPDDSFPYKRVGLQFPANLLPDAPIVCHSLRSRLNERQNINSRASSSAEILVFVLGDTTYGSCCPDCVTAEKNHADCIVHFGHSCQSPIASSIPVIFVFGSLSFDVKRVIDEVESWLLADKNEHAERSSLLLVLDDCLQWKIVEILFKLGIAIALKELKTDLFVTLPAYSYNIQDPTVRIVSNEEITRVKLNEKIKTYRVGTSNKGCKVSAVCGRDVIRIQTRTNEDTSLIEEILLESTVDGIQTFQPMNSSSQKILFLGCRMVTKDAGDEDSLILNPLLQRLLLCYGSNYPISSCDITLNSQSIQKEYSTTQKLLMKRYAYIEKARQAKTIGLLYGSIVLDSHIQMHRHLCSLLKRKRKIVHSFVVGKVNVPKLENFADIDMYCILSCPEQSVIDCKEYSKKIVTPFEMEIALNTREWTGTYIFDFQEMLTTYQEQASKESYSEEDCSEDISCDATLVDTLTLRKKDYSSTVLSISEDTLIPLRSRAFQGVDPISNDKDVTLAIEGKHGIASVYISDIDVQNKKHLHEEIEKHETPR